MMVASLLGSPTRSSALLISQHVSTAEVFMVTQTIDVFFCGRREGPKFVTFINSLFLTCSFCVLPSEFSIAFFFFLSGVKKQQ